MLLTTTTTIAWLLAIAAVPLVAGDATNNVNTTHKPYIPEGSGFPLRVSGSESLSALTIGDDGRVVVPQAKEEVLQRLLPVARTSCPSNDVPVMCGRYELSPGQSLAVATPYYPNDYPNRFSCTWTFRTSTDSEIAFSCSDFVLDRAGKDFLAVTRVSGQTPKRYKKTNRPRVTTSGGVLILTFRSNKRITAKGFNCLVTDLAVPTTTTTTTTTSTTTTTTTTTTTPPTTTTTTTTTTTEAPLPLSHPSCGVQNTRVVNGDQTEENEYPWMVWLTLSWNNEGSRRCGGTIIHEQWILTAAHCPFRLNSAQNALNPPSRISVTVGAHYHAQPGTTGGYNVEVDVNNIHLHPQYRLPYDIALLKLVSPLTFSETVKPVCLAPRAWIDDDMAGKEVTLSGWGKTETGSLSSSLREYDTVGYSLPDCISFYGSWMRPTQMCTDGAQRKHTCSGDSGGPVMRIENGKVFQVGVISFGASADCKDQSPDGQVRVAAFIDWFESITGLTFSI